MGNHAIETKNLAMLDSSTKHSGDWLEERDNRLVKPRKSVGSGQDKMANDSGMDEYPRFELM